MKKLSPVCYLACALLLLLAASCKKKDDNSNNGLSSKINNIISQDIINNLKNHGMIINTGNTPPNVEGIYIASPYTLISPYGTTDPWQAGKIVDDYTYRLYNQSGDEVELDYKQTSDAGNGLGSFLSGEGNKFSLFAQTQGTSQGIPYKQVSIISGEVTTEGIKNFQFAFVFTEKTGDDNNIVLIPVGAARIWADGDNMASVTNVFRAAPGSNTTSNAAAGNVSEQIATSKQ